MELWPRPGCKLTTSFVNIHASLVQSCTGNLIFRNLMCLSRRHRLPSRTQRYIRTFVMSSSPSLTMTESHGSRALMAVIIAIIAAMRFVGRRLRNLACHNTEPAEQEASPTLWARLVQCVDTCACQVPVLWFDTSGGREGPVPRGLRPQLPLASCNDFHSRIRPLAGQPLAVGRTWHGYRI
jgi:hypothetical protein